MDPSDTSPAEEHENPVILHWKRILVADDSPMVCRLIATKLKRFCFQIDVVADGLQAIAAVQESHTTGTPYELILMDSRMPNMHGLDATRRIRELGYTGVIVGMSASDEDGDHEAAIEAGGNGFIVKPFNWLTLFTKMRRLVPPSH